MIIIVCGGRHFSDGAFLFDTLDELHAKTPIALVVEGGQRTYPRRGGRVAGPVGGADFFAHEWAMARHVDVKTVFASWRDLSHPDARLKRDGRGKLYDANAGPRRNLKMLEFRPDAVVAFEGGHGTGDMITKARAAGVRVIEACQ